MLLSETRNARAEDETDQGPWKTRIEFSYVITSGNTDTETLAGKLTAKKEGKDNRYILKGSFLRMEDKGEETAINYVWKISENIKFTENTDYLVSIENTDRYFINSETAFEVKVNGPVSLGINYTIAYQNRPPSPDIENIDQIFLTSLIVDF